jgi:hypothetical protein
LALGVKTPPLSVVPGFQPGSQGFGTSSGPVGPPVTPAGSGAAAGGAAGAGSVVCADEIRANADDIRNTASNATDQRRQHHNDRECFIRTPGCKRSERFARPTPSASACSENEPTGHARSGVDASGLNGVLAKVVPSIWKRFGQHVLTIDPRPRLPILRASVGAESAWISGYPGMEAEDAVHDRSLPQFTLEENMAKCTSGNKNPCLAIWLLGYARLLSDGCYNRNAF